ncbi:hypothetical protein JCM6882_000889 [Rhodosporidiobolus microsporus]
MSRPSSLRSYDSRYDEVDDLDLPDYASNEGAPAEGKKGKKGSGISDDEEEGEEPLIKKTEGEAPAGGAMDVDVFSYQLGRLHCDLDTLSSRLSRLPPLIDEVRALNPSDTSLSAQSLLADLAAQTAATADVLSTVPEELRAAAGRVGFLKPGSGKFVLSAAEVAGVKTELAECADLLKGAVKEVEDGLRREMEGEKETRMRIMKGIQSSREGRGADQAAQMGMLLTAEREGQAAAEQLRAGTPGWRWSAEHPYTRLQKALSSAGDLSFLTTLKAPAAPAASLWSNPLAYVPSLPSFYPSYAKRPPSYAAPADDAEKASLGRSSSRKGSIPTIVVDGSALLDEEDRVGSYGAPLAPASGEKKPRRLLVGLVALVIVGMVVGVGVAVVVSVKKSEGGTSYTETGTDLAAQGTATAAVLPAVGRA